MASNDNLLKPIQSNAVDRRTGQGTASVRTPILTPAVLAQARLAMQRMSEHEKLRLGDELYLHQPNLLGSVLVLNRSFGASLQQIEPMIEVLMVTWQAMKISGHQWPLITEQLQSDCLQRLAAKLHFSQGVSTALREQALQQHIDSHSEPYLLAFVHEELHKQGWEQITDDTVKHIVLVALNLVECVATAAPRVN